MSAFAPVGPEDEDFHPVLAHHGFEATETAYLGFNIPEERLNCEIYVWVHPVLGTATSGVFVWRGIKTSALAAEYFDYRCFMPAPTGGLHDLRLPTGLHLEVLEPLQRLRARYHDAAADTDFDVTFRASHPPIGRPGGGHLVQPMRTAGRLRLRGRTYAVDGWFCRDRSWQEARSEVPRAVPPLTWCVGVFDEDTAFHGVGFDDPARGADWLDLYPSFPRRECLRWGFLLENGVVRPVSAWSKLTHREDGGLAPSGWSIRLDLDDGRRAEIEGQVRARLPVSVWPNMVTYFCQTRWEMNGRVAWGDAQEVQFNDFVARRSAGEG